MLKPKLEPEKIIEKIKNEKGITFNFISEEEAIEYLRHHNNYYRIASYRKNYDKKTTGEEKGKYINLDFSNLVDLSIIDMRIRFLIIHMCLDVEHDLKIRLLNDITSNSSEDGYSVVVDFLQSNEFLYEDIYKKRKSTYVGDLINKFFSFDTHINVNGKVIFDSVDVRCPIWAFVEIISFGEFIKFYDFYYSNSASQNFPIPISLLNPVKSIRNACAHNNCIINNLRSGFTKPGKVVSSFISNISDISKAERKKYLSVRPIFEFICLLIVYDKIVSEKVKKHRYSELKDLVYNRMCRNKKYYENQQLLKSTYKFLKKVVDFLC